EYECWSWIGSLVSGVVPGAAAVSPEGAPSRAQAARITAAPRGSRIRDRAGRRIGNSTHSRGVASVARPLRRSDATQRRLPADQPVAAGELRLVHRRIGLAVQGHRVLAVETGTAGAGIDREPGPARLAKRGEPFGHALARRAQVIVDAEQEFVAAPAPHPVALAQPAARGFHQPDQRAVA